MILPAAAHQQHATPSQQAERDRDQHDRRRFADPTEHSLLLEQDQPDEDDQQIGAGHADQQAPARVRSAQHGRVGGAAEQHEQTQSEQVARCDEQCTAVQELARAERLRPRLPVRALGEPGERGHRNGHQQETDDPPPPRLAARRLRHVGRNVRAGRLRAGHFPHGHFIPPPPPSARTPPTLRSSASDQSGSCARAARLCRAAASL